jgi:hypothetical protein
MWSNDYGWKYLLIIIVFFNFTLFRTGTYFMLTPSNYWKILPMQSLFIAGKTVASLHHFVAAVTAYGMYCQIKKLITANKFAMQLRIRVSFFSED